MSVPSALTPYFSASARSRGENYADANRVRLVSVQPTRIDATVRGTATYTVQLSYRLNQQIRAQALYVSCTCPFFEGGAGACKHIWATLVAASQHPGTFLMALEDLPRSALHLEPIVGDAPAPPPATPGRRLLADVASVPPAPRPVVGHAQKHFAPGALIYVLNLDAVRRGSGLYCEVLARDRKKNGEWGPPRIPRFTAHDLAAAPPVDAEILSVLLGASGASGQYGAFGLNHLFPLPTTLTRLVLPMMARSGRLHFRGGPNGADGRGASPNPTPLAWDDGPAWTFRVQAEARADGAVISGVFARDADSSTLAHADMLMLLESGFLITPTTVSRAILPAFRSLFAALVKSGPVEMTTDELATLRETLARSGISSRDLPELLHVPELDTAPQPRLTVRGRPAWTTRGQLFASVSFDYDGTIVDADVVTSAWDATRGRLIRRRFDAETAAVDRLAELGVESQWHPQEQAQALSLPAANLAALVRTLVGEGWRVDADGRTLKRPSRVAMSVSSGIDWFDLSATIEFDETTVPLTDVLAALKRGEPTVALGDGSLGLLPEQWLERYAPLAALGEAEGDRLRFRLPQTALLDALLSAQADEIAVQVDERFAAAREEVRRFDRITPVKPADSFRGELRPYQQEGLGWLGFLRRFGFGGCLADDMGLGKTVMVLAMLDAWRRDRPANTPHLPSLVVAPRSIVHNWIAEAARFTPELVVRDFSHATRKAAAEDVWAGADVVMATYGTLRGDITHLKDREFEYVILDEAQAIKNASTVSAKAVRLLRGRHRLALSGTPIENHLGELWSLFEFLNPGLLGRSSLFAGVGSTTRTVEPETASMLARGLRPFILRRTKAEVATDLPAKTEQTIVCDLDGKQRTFYNALRTHYRQALLGQVDKVGLKRSKLLVIEALLRLRQAACHPALIDASHAKTPSAKLEALVPRLREVVDEGHKAIVFSQFTSFLALVEEALHKEGIVYEYLDGQTRDREPRVKRFQEDKDCPVFLVSLKAGGLGLNLTAAEYVFLLDPWWNPAVEAQAIDRAHRIGQTRHVFAYRLIARDTVEEKVLALQETKRSLADAILRADAGLIGQLGREDLELLLS